MRRTTSFSAAASYRVVFGRRIIRPQVWAHRIATTFNVQAFPWLCYRILAHPRPLNPTAVTHLRNESVVSCHAGCAGLPEQARMTIEVPPKGKQPARQASVALRFGAISLTRPVRGGARDHPRTVSLWVVDVSEIDPPEGVEPLHWRLLTTHALGTPAEACQVVGWYRLRWIIEQVFRSLKSHCLRTEDSQMREVRAFVKLAVIALIAAVRAMQLVLARDASTGQPVTDAVDPAEMPALRGINASLEGRTAKLKNPYDPRLLAWYAWIVARLGGWSGYTSRGYKPAGPKTVHHGLIRVDQILLGWHLANRSADG